MSQEKISEDDIKILICVCPGASVVINHVDKEWAPLNLLCQRLSRRFPHAFTNM